MGARAAASRQSCQLWRTPSVSWALCACREHIGQLVGGQPKWAKPIIESFSSFSLPGRSVPGFHCHAHLRLQVLILWPCQGCPAEDVRRAADRLSGVRGVHFQQTAHRSRVSAQGLGLVRHRFSRRLAKRCTRQREPGLRQRQDGRGRIGSCSFACPSTIACTRSCCGWRIWLVIR